jgi:hypothetical protein
MRQHFSRGLIGVKHVENEIAFANHDIFVLTCLRRNRSAAIGKWE